MSPNRLLTEPSSPRSVRAPTCCYAGGREGHSSMTIVIEKPRQASWVAATHGFPSMPGVWGLSRAHIVSDSCDLLSHLFFVEMWVESELSSNSAWQVGRNFSLGRISWLPEMNFASLRNDIFSFCLEFVRWLLGCRLQGGLDEDTWIRNTSISSLSLLISQSKDYTCRLLSCWRLSMFSH